MSLLPYSRKKKGIPQKSSDPANPYPKQVWVLDTSSYQLSYRTKENTTIRVALT